MFFIKQLLFGVLVLCSTALTAQNRPYHIQGVIFENNQPAAQVRITLQEYPNISTATDQKGIFSLDVPSAKVQLAIEKNDFLVKTVEVRDSGNENRLTYIEVHLDQMEELQEVLITDNPSLITNSRSALQQKAEAVPGASVLRDLSILKFKRSQTLKDAIGDVPGVLIQDFFGGNDQPRLNIRGSGIQSNPQTRGIMLLQDGIPINLTDGSYVIGLLEPQAAHLIAIQKGSNALQYGSSTLGGAINLITRNGYNASPLAVKLEGGSFGYFNGSLSSGINVGKNDIFVATSYNRSDGFRSYNDSERFNILLNAGRRFSENFESRLLLNYTDLSFDVSGPLTYGQIFEDPKQINTTPTPQNIGPNVLRDQPGRETQALRIGNKNTYQINAQSKLDGTLYYQYSDDEFTFPIATGIRNNISNDAGINLAYELETENHHFSAGAALQFGQIQSKYFLNNAGQPAGLFSNNYLESTRYAFFMNEVYSLSPKWDLVGALQFSWDDRTVKERLADPSTRPSIDFMRAQQGGELLSSIPSSAVSGKSHYFGFNPKLGVLYKVHTNGQLFANFSRSYEPPTFIELMLYEGGTPNSSPQKVEAAELKAQEASTIEVGYRGTIDRLRWDLSLYNSWVQKELLTITDNGLFTGHTINSSASTIHRGIEAGINADIFQNALTDHDVFTLTANYTYSDFYFKDGDYKNHQIGGIPKHYLVSGLEYRHPTGFGANFNIESLPEKTPIAHNNDIYQKPYTLLNARLSFQQPKWGLYIEGRNLADKKYATSYLVIDRAIVPPMPGADKNSVTNFIPGVGQNFVGGIYYNF